MFKTDVINVVVANNHTIIRNGLINIIRSWTDISILFEVNRGDDLIKKTEQAELLPDVYIVDLAQAVYESYDAIKEMKKRWPELKVLVLSVFNTEFSIIRMINIGANGFLSVDCNPDELHTAILDITDKGFYYSPEIPEQFFKKAKSSSLLKITTREMEFLNLCCSDLGYKSIADQMGISVRTIESYRDSLYDKLHVKSRMGLMIYALKTGIFPTDKLQQLTVRY